MLKINLRYRLPKIDANIYIVIKKRFNSTASIISIRHIEIVLMVKDSSLGIKKNFQPVNGVIIEKNLIMKHNAKIYHYTDSTNTKNTNMTELIYGKTQQGKALFILDGHEITKKRDTKSTTHWRCAKWRSYIFPMTLITCDETITSFNHEHRQEFKSGCVEARVLVNHLKETAESQINRVKNQLIAASLKTVNSIPAIQVSLPSRAALTRTLIETKCKDYSK